MNHIQISLRNLAALFSTCHESHAYIHCPIIFILSFPIGKSKQSPSMSSPLTYRVLSQLEIGANEQCLWALRTS